MFRPQVVFHTGADKQVTLMESNADEAVFNIIIGAKNVLEVAEKTGAERVVMVSTAHAVDPTSVMGCCKRVAEQLGEFRIGDVLAAARQPGRGQPFRGHAELDVLHCRAQ